jgi:hypothetical protein
MGKKVKNLKEQKEAAPVNEPPPANPAAPGKEAAPAPPPPRRRKLLLWALGLLLFYTVAGFFILPPIIRSVAVKQISKQLDREVSIRQVKLNPFAFSTTIRGLLIKDKDGEPFVSWDEVYVNFQLSSFLGHPWVFKNISVTGPFARAQMNRDGTFNFSDLITKFSPTNAPAAPPKALAIPIALRIGRLEITNATASVTDLTHRMPFKRTVGPLNFTLEHFRTDPSNKNPHTFAGTTDAGETISWSGFFFLDPLHSQGELTMDNFSLNKYSPLYEERLPFEIRDGVVGVHVNYHLDLSATNRVMAITDTSFTLRNFKLASPGAKINVVELNHLAVTGVSADAVTRRAEIASVLVDGGRINRLRSPDTLTNVAGRIESQAIQKVTTSVSALNGIQELLGLVTNGVALFLHTTNLCTATVHDVEFANCAFHLEDQTASRPARLDLEDIAVSVKNFSNEPKTNLAVGLSLRWNTNGAIKTDVSAVFSPLTVDVQLALDRLDFGTLDPYLEPKFNLLILGSQLGLHGQVRLRTPEEALPEITFQGDVRLDDFHTVDGVMGEDLLNWGSVRVSGIDANVNPLGVTIKEIALDNVAASLVIGTNRTVNLLAALHPAGTDALADTNVPAITNEVVAKTSVADTYATLAAATPPIAIGSIVISNASASFSDRSLTPNLNMTVQKFGGSITGLSSTETRNAGVNLHAAVDGVGPVDITGHINPFNLTGTKDLKITLKDMNLTPASPYSGKFAGYRITEGKLNLDLAYDLNGRKLKSQNVITLDRFTFGDKVDSTNATHLPVRLAIAILKDRNGQILLDVPVEGSLDDPQFRIGKVVMHTLLNILVKAATSPFSLLGAAFGGGGQELSYQDFAPGNAVLSLANESKLDSLVKGLYERPGLQLEIAGSVDSEADRDGLRRASLEKQIHTRQWQSLRKSERATTAPDQIVLTPEQRAAWVKKLYSEAVGKGVINTALIAANTNLATLAAQIKPAPVEAEKGATQLMNNRAATTPKPAKAGAATATMPTDPKELLLLASIPVTDSDFETLATDRARAVLAYILQTGKVEAGRLFLTENKTGGVRSDGSRVYLQFR